MPRALPSRERSCPLSAGARPVGTTDSNGRCTIVALPAGDYLVRVHRTGFTVAHSLVLRVTPGHITSYSVVLIPVTLDRPVATNGESPGIMTAGFLPTATTGVAVPTDPGQDDDIEQSEVAWRLRHLRRSVLKDAVDQVHLAEDGNFEDGVGAFFGRAMTAPVRAAASLFSEAPLTGQVNLLTTSTFDSTDKILSDLSLARGVAYLSLGAGAGSRGDWSARAALTQGDLSSWMLAGSFISRAPTRHRYEVGMTLAAQRYRAPTWRLLAAVSDGTRNAGAVYAFDTWTIARTVSVVYGARYASYGYIEKGLFSPRLQVNLQPSHSMRVMMSASRRSEAPGAEEFVPSTASTRPRRLVSSQITLTSARSSASTLRPLGDGHLDLGPAVPARTAVQHPAQVVPVAQPWLPAPIFARLADTLIGARDRPSLQLRLAALGVLRGAADSHASAGAACRFRRRRTQAGRLGAGLPARTQEHDRSARRAFGLGRAHEY